MSFRTLSNMVLVRTALVSNSSFGNSASSRSLDQVDHELALVAVHELHADCVFFSGRDLDAVLCVARAHQLDEVLNAHTELEGLLALVAFEGDAGPKKVNERHMRGVHCSESQALIRSIKSGLFNKRLDRRGDGFPL